MSDKDGEHAALVRDAERYRFLRDQDNAVFDLAWDLLGETTKEDIDRFVDDLIAHEPKGE